MINLHALDTLVANHLAFDVASARAYHHLGLEPTTLDSILSNLKTPDALSNCDIDLGHQDNDVDNDVAVDKHAVIACAAIRRLRYLILQGNVDQVLTILSTNISDFNAETELHLRIHTLVELLFASNSSAPTKNTPKHRLSDALIYSQQLAKFSLHAFPEAYDAFKLAMMLFIVPEPSSNELQRRRQFISANVLALVRHFADQSKLCSQLSVLIRYLGVICCSKRPHLVDLSELFVLRQQQNQTPLQSTVRATCKLDSPFISFSNTSPSIGPLNEADVQSLPERTGISRDDAVNLLKLANGDPEWAIRRYLACVLLKPQTLRRLVIDYCAARGLHELFNESDNSITGVDDSKTNSNETAEKSANTDNKSSPSPSSTSTLAQTPDSANTDEVFRKIFNYSSFSEDDQFEDVEDDQFFPSVTSFTDRQPVISVPSSYISRSSRVVGLIMNDVRKALTLHYSDEIQASKMLRDAASRACATDSNNSSNSSSSPSNAGDAIIERHLWFRLAQRDVLFAFQTEDFPTALSTIVKHLAPAAASDAALQSQLHDTLMLVVCASQSDRTEDEDDGNDDDDDGDGTKDVNLQQSQAKDTDVTMSEGKQTAKKQASADEVNRNAVQPSSSSSTTTTTTTTTATGASASGSASISSRKSNIDSKSASTTKQEKHDQANHDESDFDVKINEARETVYDFCSPCAIGHNIYQALVARHGQPELVRLLDSLLSAHLTWQSDAQMKDRFEKAFGMDVLNGRSGTGSIGGNAYGKGMNWMMGGIGGGRRGRRGRNGCQKRRRLRSGAKQKMFVSGDEDDEDMDDSHQDTDNDNDQNVNSGDNDVDSRMEQTVLTLMEFLAMSRADAVAVVRNHPRSANPEVILDSLLGAS